MKTKRAVELTKAIEELIDAKIHLQKTANVKLALNRVYMAQANLQAALTAIEIIPALKDAP